MALIPGELVPYARGRDPISFFFLLRPRSLRVRLIRRGTIDSWRRDVEGWMGEWGGEGGGWLFTWWWRGAKRATGSGPAAIGRCLRRWTGGTRPGAASCIKKKRTTDTIEIDTGSLFLVLLLLFGSPLYRPQTLRLAWTGCSFSCVWNLSWGELFALFFSDRFQSASSSIGVDRWIPIVQVLHPTDGDRNYLYIFHRVCTRFWLLWTCLGALQFDKMIRFFELVSYRFQRKLNYLSFIVLVLHLIRGDRPSFFSIIANSNGSNQVSIVVFGIQ